MPELTSAPTETTLADADEVYFNDVSETPDAINRITWANLRAVIASWLGFTAASSSGPTQMQYFEDTDNGTNKVTLKAADSLAADYTVTLPSSTGTLAVVADVSAAAALKANETKAVVGKTSDYPVVVGDHDTIFTNAGAAGAVKFTLPASAGCTAGKTRFIFFCTDAQTIEIEPDGSDHLQGYSDRSALAFDTTNGDPIANNAEIGSSMSVVFIGGGVWAATSTNGTWTP